MGFLDGIGGKDQRNYLYDCIQRKDVSSLAKFMMIMNVGEAIDDSLAERRF